MQPIPCPQPVTITVDIPKGMKDRKGTLLNVSGNLASVLVDGVKWPFYVWELELSKG